MVTFKISAETFEREGRDEVYLEEDFDNALIVNIEKFNWIMDYGFERLVPCNSLHRSNAYFKSYSNKVRISYNKSLDIIGVRYVVFKITLGSKLTIKSVKYIPNLNEILI